MEPSSARLRAVVDTNVWISGLLSAARPASATQHLVRASIDREFVAIISRPLLDELAGVVSRPRFTNTAPTWTVAATALVALLEAEPIVALAGVGYGCRDPDDNALIETAIRGGAQYLVTGDRDLIDANVAAPLNAHGVLLITARAFVAELKRRRP